MKEMNAKEFNEMLENNEKPVLVDFWAEWCAPCQMIKPILEKLSVDKDLKEKIDFVSIDVESNNELASKYGVRAIPTLLLIHPKNGVLLESVGFLDEERLKTKINDALKKDASEV